MGYYIETKHPLGKVERICLDYQASRVSNHEINLTRFDDMRKENKAIICVFHNGLFDAAGFCFSEKEFREFLGDKSGRQKTWLIMDWNKACELTSYVEKK